jgi:oligopeptide transport system ATP-binding protein
MTQETIASEYGSAESTPLLQVTDLSVSFRTGRSSVRAVDGVSLTLSPGETLAIVGESGSGKSVTALSVIRLLPRTAQVSGRIDFAGTDVLSLSPKDLRSVRGGKIAMVYQDPMTALTPSMTIGRQITETMRAHSVGTREDRHARAVELIGGVGIPDPERVCRSFPHQLSGGMRQRAMIAIALSCDPQVLLADEITTALDVTVQAQILELLGEIARQSNMAAMFITHNLAVVARIADRVQVMYGGQVVERAHCEELFYRPLMPYTLGLLKSTPHLDDGRLSRMTPIPGDPPDPRSWPVGCRFAPRCAYRRNICDSAPPPLLPAPGGSPDHEVRCWGIQPGDGTGWLAADAAAVTERAAMTRVAAQPGPGPAEAAE